MVDFHFQPSVQPGGHAACDDQKYPCLKKHTPTLGLGEEIAFLDLLGTPKAVPPFSSFKAFVSADSSIDAVVFCCLGVSSLFVGPTCLRLFKRGFSVCHQEVCRSGEELSPVQARMGDPPKLVLTLDSDEKRSRKSTFNLFFHP